MMKHFNEDDVIVREGECSPAMYKIIHGKAAVYLNYGEDSEYLIRIISEQKFFGELSLICGMPSLYTVTAVSDILVTEITEEEFDKFVVENPKDVKVIMKNVGSMMLSMKKNIDMLREEIDFYNDKKNVSIDTVRGILRRYSMFSADDLGREFGSM